MSGDVIGDDVTLGCPGVVVVPAGLSVTGALEAGGVAIGDDVTLGCPGEVGVPAGLLVTGADEAGGAAIGEDVILAIGEAVGNPTGLLVTGAAEAVGAVIGDDVTPVLGCPGEVGAPAGLLVTGAAVVGNTVTLELGAAVDDTTGALVTAPDGAKTGAAVPELGSTGDVVPVGPPGVLGVGAMVFGGVVTGDTVTVTGLLVAGAMAVTGLLVTGPPVLGSTTGAAVPASGAAVPELGCCGAMVASGVPVGLLVTGAVVAGNVPTGDDVGPSSGLETGALGREVVRDVVVGVLVVGSVGLTGVGVATSAIWVGASDGPGAGMDTGNWVGEEPSRDGAAAVAGATDGVGLVPSEGTVGEVVGAGGGGAFGADVDPVAVVGFAVPSGGGVGASTEGVSAFVGAKVFKPADDSGGGVGAAGVGWGVSRAANWYAMSKSLSKSPS